MRTDVLGVGFDDITMEEAVGQALELLNGSRPAYVVTPNPEIVWMCRDDPGLKDILSQAALVLPDGIGIVYGSKILGRALKGTVGGTDFAEKLVEKLSKSGKSIYLLGGKPGVAEAAAANIKEKYRGIIIAGTADGYFKDDGPVIARINAARPDFLMVCLGAPKQERWMAMNKDILNIGIMAGLGGSFDVFAGMAARAPLSWRKRHLEWLYRLIKQPRRITRMIKLPLYLFAVIGQRIKGQ